MKNYLIPILALSAISAHAAEPMHNYRVENHQFRMEFLEDFYQSVGYTPPAAAAYISANGTSWSPWTSVIAGGQIGYTPTNKVALYCQATATSAWAPCNPGGGTAVPSGPAGGDLGGTYPNPTVVGSHIASGTINGATIGVTTPAAVNATTLTSSGNTNLGLTFVDQINPRSVAPSFGQFNSNGNVFTRSNNDGIPAAQVNNAAANTSDIIVFQKSGVTQSRILNGGGYSGPQVIFTGTAPTMVAGAAAGTTPTCTSVTGTNGAFVISCTTGTATTTGTLATITFNGTLPVAPVGCSLTARNAATAPTMTSVFTTAPSATTWTIGVATALTVSTAYVWSGTCI